MSFRENGVNALKTVLKIEKNIVILEKYIFNSVPNITEDVYNERIFQVIGDIINKQKLNAVLDNIKNNKFGWRHDCFLQDKYKIEEQDDFIVNPFVVEEGVLQCSKCESKRVYSYQRQTRGSDEPMTTFAECVACKSKWIYNG